MNVLIFFSNPMVDKKTLKADIRCNLQVLRPDGKVDINDASSFLGDLLGGGANGEGKGLNLGSLLKTFKI